MQAPPRPRSPLFAAPLVPPSPPPLAQPPPLPMPYRGSRKAPTFDPGDPLTVARFFDDMDRMFRRSQVEDEVERLDFVLSYVPNEVWRPWQVLASLPESATYAGFKKMVLDLYPEADDSHVLSWDSYKELVAARRSQPFTSVEDYAAFYRDFFPLSCSLVTRQYMVERTRSADLLSLLHGEQLARVTARLDILFPDLHRDALWPTAAINNTIVWDFTQRAALFFSSLDPHPSPSPVQSPAPSSAPSPLQTIPVAPSSVFVPPSYPEPSLPIPASSFQPSSPFAIVSSSVANPLSSSLLHPVPTSHPTPIPNPEPRPELR